MASQKQALLHSFSELTPEILQVRSKGAILDIDVISGDLKQLNLKSNRFLKQKNSDFMACSGVPNHVPFTVKTNIFKVILGSRVFAWKLILDHNYTCKIF